MNTPLVSCLMITQTSRLKMAERALKCFESQTWPNKEVIIVSSNDVAPLGRPFVRAPAGITIGELRNISLDNAQGDIVATWDDDDISSPDRLTDQIARLTENPNNQACLLTRMQLAWPARHRYAISGRKTTWGWEPTMIAWKSAVQRYQALKRNSDNVLIKTLRVVTLDDPSLYTYVYHGDNVWPSYHFEGIFQLGEFLSSEDPRKLKMEKSLGRT